MPKRETMKLKFIHILCCIFLVFDSCIDSFDIKLNDIQKYIVIDGLITDQPGPYTIKLFRSASLDDQLSPAVLITGAFVVIKDDLNNTYALTEITAGNYKTPANFQGTVGRTYVLQMKISENEQYESLPQKLLPVGEIEKVYYEFVQVEDSVTSNLANDPKNGFHIYLDGTVLPEQNKLVRWRTVGTYEITTYPANRKKPSNGLIIIMIPDPPLCSGLSLIPYVHVVGPCTCCLCWPSIYDPEPILSESKFLNNDHVERLELAFVPARKDFFSKKYYFKVEQMSVTPEAFAFWQSIKKQAGTGSDLFQTPSGKTAGNMKPIGNTKTPIIGLFGVSAVRSHSLFIDKNEVPYRVWAPERFEESCMKIITRYNTNVKPDYWN
jgi:hypothetical protein